MKTHAEIEAWALAVVDRVKARRPNEDARVEAKGQWPEPQQAARQIAGLANAARGGDLLWVVGLDESDGVRGVEHIEFSTWWAQVCSFFQDRLCPNVVDLVVPVDGSVVVALLFEADRVPYVVRNPVHGKQGGGPVEREVPWREGTSTRSATRADLLRLLVPATRRLTVTVVGGRLELVQRRSERQEWSWHLDLTAYIEVGAGSRESIIVPDYRCSGRLGWSQLDHKIALHKVYLTGLRDGGVATSLARLGLIAPAPEPVVTAERGEQQMLIYDSGPVRVVGSALVDPPEEEVLEEMWADLALQPLGGNRTAIDRVRLKPEEIQQSDEEHRHAAWSVVPPPRDVA